MPIPFESLQDDLSAQREWLIAQHPDGTRIWCDGSVMISTDAEPCDGDVDFIPKSVIRMWDSAALWAWVPFPSPPVDLKVILASCYRPCELKIDNERSVYVDLPYAKAFPTDATWHHRVDLPYSLVNKKGGVSADFSRRCTLRVRGADGAVLGYVMPLFADRSTIETQISGDVAQ